MFFGIILNVVLFIVVYVFTALYLWSNINIGNWKIPVFLILYIAVVYILKIVITKIYKTFIRKNTLDEFINVKLYGIDNSHHWGGVFHKFDEASENSGNVITGGSLFVALFCLKKILKIS